jgi:hypothetical protein
MSGFLRLEKFIIAVVVTPSCVVDENIGTTTYFAAGAMERPCTPYFSIRVAISPDFLAFSTNS